MMSGKEIEGERRLQKLRDEEMRISREKKDRIIEQEKL